MNIWMVSMEFAGIAEAGGVKNVSRSLSEELSRCGNKVTLFIPLFGCTSFDEIEDRKEDCLPAEIIRICGKNETVSYTTAVLANTSIRVVFVTNPHFSEKLAVYTYTAEEEKADPSHKKGNGHVDSLLIEALFQRAVAQFGKNIQKTESPDIVLCEDAPAAVLPSYIACSRLSVFKKTKCVVTIHNAGPAYHHEFNSIMTAGKYTGLPFFALCKALNGKRVEPFLLAAECAALTTVSTQYALELCDPSRTKETDGLSEIFARRRIHITGITNGIDYERYNPSDCSKSLLPYSYNPEQGEFDGKYLCRNFFLSCFADKEWERAELNTNDYLSGITRAGYLKPCIDAAKTVYFSYHGRIVSQKGIEVLAAAAKNIVSMYENVRFVIIGQGETSLEQNMESLAESSGGRIVFFKGYNRAMARLASAVSDFIVLPSYFEPCGLEDLIAQIFGTIPVAHATGGLKKIEDSRTGFLYNENTPEKLTATLSALIERKEKAPDCFRKIAIDAAVCVHEKYSWHEVVLNQYIPFFNILVKSY
jgi:starch synthase